MFDALECCKGHLDFATERLVNWGAKGFEFNLERPGPGQAWHITVINFLPISLQD